MKYSPFALLFLCAVLVAPVFGQTKKSPAAPAAPRAAAEAAGRSWQEYTNDKFDFWITFPVAPGAVASESVDGFTNFQAATGRAEYGLMVKKLLVSMSNYQLDELFESVVGATEDEQTRLIAEKNVYLNGVLGKELVYEEQEKIVFGRFFIVESKLFMLTVSVAKKDYDKSFDRFAMKFFDSFGVKANQRMDA